MSSGTWPPNRDHGLAQLTAFVPSAGRAYAAKRNFDYGRGAHTHVSKLSPYVRHRLITEAEVVDAVLANHSLAAAEKFIQEVCWRTYWKGWLEQRPQVWDHYLAALANARSQLHDDDALAAEVAAAERGASGLACMDAWTRELIETGYLHNHARMWFASIWIFTLRLPWTLGADFFYRHLLDGDPASNTLSWRWVAGLQTRGKTYLARPDNIATFTGGRFSPAPGDLAPYATPIQGAPVLDRTPLRVGDQLPRSTNLILVLTEDDLSPESWNLDAGTVGGIAVFSPFDVGPAFAPAVRAFKAGAFTDARARAGALWNVPTRHISTGDELATFALEVDATYAVTTVVPVGYLKPEVDALAGSSAAAGVPLLKIARPWDALFWPHAKAGFFQFKASIPAVLSALDLTTSGETTR